VAANLNLTFGGFTEAGKRAYGLNDPIIVKEYTWSKGTALLARKDERWLISVMKSSWAKPRIIGIDEISVNDDALRLGLTAERVARYECEGILARYGWSNDG
jgi:hypothetical protein